MAFRLEVSDTVAVPVKGHLADANGVPQPFAFSLNCSRMKGAGLDALAKTEDRTMGEVITGAVVGWSGVLGDDDRPQPFSPDALARMLDIVGMPGVIFNAYIEACGARGKEKN